MQVASHSLCATRIQMHLAQHNAYQKYEASTFGAPEGMRLNISSHEGSYPARWKNLNVEVYGLAPKQRELYVNAKRISAGVDGNPRSVNFVIQDDGGGAEIEVK